MIVSLRSDLPGRTPEGPGTVQPWADTGDSVSTTAANAPQREVIPGLESVITPAFPPAIRFEIMNKPQGGKVYDAKVVQARDYNSNELRTWPSGDPMMILVLLVKDDNGDDRSLWIQGANLTTEFRKALTRAGVTGIAIGDSVEVDWIGEEPVFDNKGKELKDPRKLYVVDIQPV